MIRSMHRDIKQTRLPKPKPPRSNASSVNNYFGAAKFPRYPAMHRSITNAFLYRHYLKEQMKIRNQSIKVLSILFVREPQRKINSFNERDSKNQ